MVVSLLISSSIAKFYARSNIKQKSYQMIAKTVNE